MSYRYKIIDRELILEDYSHKIQPVQTIYQRLCSEIKKGHINPQNTILIPCLENQRPLTDTHQNEIEKIDMEEVEYFIDVCSSSRNFTIHNIFKSNKGCESLGFIKNLESCNNTIYNTLRVS
jgi:hypothetical protein